ncbi:unnamed protein product, partial [Nesidiocoris tenuis]
MSTNPLAHFRGLDFFCLVSTFSVSISHLSNGFSRECSQGDSGGPLVVNQPGTCLKKQVGVTSFGRDCGLPNTPGIYTRVSAYIPWIESIVW